MINLQHRITFFDLETGGMNPKRHPIIQIGAVTVNHDFSAFKQFERKIIFDESRAEQQALAMNSYDRELWKREAVKPSEAAKAFAKFLSQAADVPKVSKWSGKKYKVAQLAAHNAAFDRGFIFPWFKQLDIFFPAEWHVIDTMQLAMTVNTLFGEKPKSLKLVDLCDHYGIELENAHDALGDVVATARLGRELLTRLRSP